MTTRVQTTSLLTNSLTLQADKRPIARPPPGSTPSLLITRCTSFGGLDGHVQFLAGGTTDGTIQIPKNQNVRFLRGILEEFESMKP